MEGVTTRVPDLRGVSLKRLFAERPAPAEAVAQLLERAEEPGRSISGYNPQRLD